MDSSPPRDPLRVTFVTGVVPDKWAARWRARRLGPLDLVPVEQGCQLDAMLLGEAHMAFVRLPAPTEGLHLVRLYTERWVVVVSREHPAAAYDELSLADLADEHLLQDPDEHPGWRDVSTEVRAGTRFPVPRLGVAQVVESVAADAGIALLPMSVARVHHRKDVVAVPVTDLDGADIGLVWPRDADDPRLQTFVGVVRGRTENSSRDATEPSGTVARRPARAGAGKGQARRQTPRRPRRPRG